MLSRETPTGRGGAVRPQVRAGLALAGTGLALLAASSTSAMPTPVARAAADARTAARAPDSCRGGGATAASLGWPTDRAAWRAQPQAPDRPLSALPRRGARAPAAGRALDPAVNPWLLVLRVARGGDGRCWVQLRLPSRPNDASGWLPARRLQLQPTPWRISISRAARSLTLYRGGRADHDARVVIGASATPTPGGLFATEGVWRNDPDDFSGAWIVALTAHSRELRRFDGGEGRVAIHGRGGVSLLDPLGSARSHGCVRVANGDLDGFVTTVGWPNLVGIPVRVR